MSITDKISSSLQDYSAEGKKHSSIRHQLCPPAEAENISPVVLQHQVIHHIGDEHVFSTIKQALRKVVHLIFCSGSAGKQNTTFWHLLNIFSLQVSRW